LNAAEKDSSAMDLTAKRILVTGGNGFLGRHLTSRLRRLGCRQVYAPGRDELDLMQRPAVESALRERQPQVVFHLAARVGGIGANQLQPGTEPVNVGSGEEISIGALAGLIASVVGYRGRIRFDRSKPDGQPRRRLDTSRARERMGFVARVRLAAGLERTVEWYRSREATPAAAGSAAG
jgi:nucleoside-diphosphate-sugar epimerase